MNKISLAVKRYKMIREQLDKYALLTPKNTFLTKVDMIWCGIRYGASPSNYYNFEFYNATATERATYVTHRISQKLMALYNKPEHLDCLYNKYKFSQKFNTYYGRNCIYSKENAQQFLCEHFGEYVIYKPLCGNQGKGIEVFNVDDPISLANTLKKLPEGVVESWITQHPKMQKLYPHSINPIRIQTINKGGHVACLCATLTVGNKARFANASSHALFALVDIDTGIVSTHACDYDGNFYITHPETNMSFKNFAIPHWNELLKVVTAAAKELPSVGYIGWDVAITDTGVALIEGNNDPGYTAYQLPKLTGTHTGTLPKYKPFLL